jgi:hypothetical protein
MSSPPHGSFEQRGQSAPARNRQAEGRFAFMLKHLAFAATQ